jgi:hypothetical protein
MRRDKNQNETEQANEIIVVLVPSFIEKKDVGVAEEKKSRADSIEKTDHDEKRQNSEHDAVNVKTVTRPGVNPGKTIVFKKKVGFEPKRPDPIA